MTQYPNLLDNDLDLPRIEGNLTIIGGAAINALRDAMFAVQETLGINPQGTCGDVATRLDVALNPDGTLKAAAITGLGLVTLPIINSEIAAGAGIVESKLNLDFSTAVLNASIVALGVTVDGINTILTELNTDFTLHIYGQLSPTVADGYTNRHVASHVDINNGFFNGYPQYTGIDPRDILFNNTGLLDLTGAVRNAKTVMHALLQINNDFLAHALSTSSVTHPATFVSVDTSNFGVIPVDKTNVQLVLDFIDDYESGIIEKHRAEQHSNGIPRTSRIVRFENDGYNTIYGPFACDTSKTSGGLGQLSFTAVPGDLDWAFRQIVPGDIVKVNYGGYTTDHTIDSIIYTPSTTYTIIIDGYVLDTVAGASALFEKSKYDDNHYGALAVTPANHNYYAATPEHAVVPGSAIIVSPNCAAATGLDFAPDDLDSTHYMLYIAYYPTGSPADVNLVPPTSLLGIDVTGNLGITPGKYSLKHVVETTNRAFRAGGYNYRFVAFEYKGQFGIALADTIDNASFSIISGTASGTSLTAGSYTNNVVGDATSPIKDPLGLGYTKANVASPDYQAPAATSLPTKVISRKRNRKYNVDGQYIDYLAKGQLTNASGYYDGYLRARQALGTTRTKGIYRVSQDLQNSDLKVGSTIVVYPAIDRSDASFKEQDYGRFIVEYLDYGCCPGDGWTDITVITCTSLSGDPNYIGTTPPPDLAVKIYFSNDSVSFENNDGTTYRNLFEIFVKKYGKTFSHKRCRLQLTAPGSGRELDTQIGTTYIDDGYGWHIVDMSPKFRGFYPATSPATDLRKFIRFIINNYSAVDDSYDGYIGQPNDATLGGILNTGPVTRVRKGNVARYYDNTGVDYIEIQFTENLLTTALDITVPANEFRYTDIEVFDTMRSNDEQMCLAVCEQTSSGSDKTFIANFIDKRQFGTVSEKVFTTSAIEFIEASDRLFRQNGVARGFEYKGMSGDNLVFNGGTAVVNGTIVNVNSFTVFPFEMKNASPPTTVQYVVCLKSDGTHEAVVINTTSSTQEYTTGREIVYTLAEIIATRKDLLPLHIFTVITASLTVSPDVEDVRKFIANHEINTPLTLVGPINESEYVNTVVGSFASWSAICNYVRYANKVNSTILVKNDTTISSTVDFGGVPVTIKGERGNMVRCTADVGIVLQSYITIDGVNFVREFDETGLAYYTTGYSKGTLVLAVSGNTSPVVYENMIIQNCTFDTTSGFQASGVAHILFEETGPRSRSVFANIKILNNRFKESTFPQLDIAFVSKNGDILADPITYGVLGHGTVLNSVTLDGNCGGHDSWIMLSSDNYDSGAGSSRGLSAYGVRLINNNFTHIWYNLSRYVSAGFDGTSYLAEYNRALPVMNAEFDVIGNSFNDLINRAIDGIFLGIDVSLFSVYVYKEVKVASPSMNISNNRCTSIAVSINGDVYESGGHDYPKGMGAIQISNNIIQSSPYDALEFGPTQTYETNSNRWYAIAVSGNMSNGYEKKNLVKITGNIISNEMQGFDIAAVPSYDYLCTMFVTVPCDIQNNTIDKCIADSYKGIWLNYIYPLAAGEGDDTYFGQITNNTIIRGNTDIHSYIFIGGDDKIGKIAIKDNIFDGYTVTNTPTTLNDHYAIKYDLTPYNKVCAERNIGQMFFTDLTPNINSSIGHYDNYASGLVVGWRTMHNVSTGAMGGGSFYINNQIKTALDLDTFADGTTYNIAPFVINLPSYDGADGLAFSFVVKARTVPAKDIRVYASSQYAYDRSISLVVPSVVIYPVTNITNAVSDYFTTDDTPQIMHVKIDDLYDTYYSEYYQSADKYFPIFLFFVDESDPTTISTLTRTTSANFDYIIIDQVFGQFRY